jgi:hypothetical protein
MSQDIITFMIIFGAVSYTIWSFARALKPGRSSSCNDCGGCAVKKDFQASITLKNNNHVTGKRLPQF